MGRTEDIRKILEALPSGYISKKNIKGKTYHYYQWNENGKKRSRYLHPEDVELYSSLIEQRRMLTKELEDLLMSAAAKRYKTNVVAGDRLRNQVEYCKDFRKREIFSLLEKFLHENDRTHVCALYGLRRTGKTTMMFQAIAGLSMEDFSKAAYLKVRSSNVIRDVTDDLDVLVEAGFRFVFIDEVTLMEDFINAASLLSDIYALMGMKIVLSGTDSLGFYLSETNELYDRVRMIHTTFIPYREYSRILAIDSIDEFIRYGGTLRKGDDLDFIDSPFADDESTRKYIDTAISRNIQHSLANFNDKKYFRQLYSLYDNNELTDAINRIVEDMNHRFVLSVLEKDFVSSDPGISARNLRNEKDPGKRSDLLESIDKQKVTRELMRILDIRNQEERETGITPDHVVQIRQYLEALDLIVHLPVVSADARVSRDSLTLFTQCGMRYAQAEALLHSLMMDEEFNKAGKTEKDLVSNRILEEVRGRLLEEIVLLETMKAYGKRADVFKMFFDRGEFDMVIYDNDEQKCSLFEIKHSDKITKEQRRHLMNEEYLETVSSRFGPIASRCVLYTGEESVVDGIIYMNVKTFLNGLEDIAKGPSPAPL